MHSSRGETKTKVRTHHTNSDGSYHEHGDFHYSDPEGKGCNSEGVPRSGGTQDDDDVDAEGNHKRHVKSIEEKNGKCIKYVDDWEWDRNGKLIRESHSKTEVPCGKYMLEVLYKGSISVTHSTITYGPNTVKIYLESGRRWHPQGQLRRSIRCHNDR